MQKGQKWTHYCNPAMDPQILVNTILLGREGRMRVFNIFAGGSPHKLCSVEHMDVDELTGRFLFVVHQFDSDVLEFVRATHTPMLLVPRVTQINSLPIKSQIRLAKDQRTRPSHQS